MQRMWSPLKGTKKWGHFIFNTGGMSNQWGKMDYSINSVGIPDKLSSET